MRLIPLILCLQDAFDPFADTDEDDEVGGNQNGEDQTPGTPRPGSPITEAVDEPIIPLKKGLPWTSKVR